MKDVGVCFELVTQELRNSWEGGLGGFCIPAFREFAIHVQDTCVLGGYITTQSIFLRSLKLLFTCSTAVEALYLFVLWSTSCPRGLPKQVQASSQSIGFPKRYPISGAWMWVLGFGVSLMWRGCIVVRFGRVHLKSSHPTCRSVPGQFQFLTDSIRKQGC